MGNLPGANTETLRRLLALARDLLQAPTLTSILETVGPALRDLLAADAALLLIRSGDAEHSTEFDRHGRMHPSQQDSILHEHARRAMADRTPILLPDVSPHDALAGPGSASLLALPFPPGEPVGVLAALWRGRARTEHLAGQVSTVRYIGDLTAAALGNTVARRELEARLAYHAAQSEKDIREHAAELDRRDLIEDELKRLAITDAMTGVLNRRGFFLEAERGLKLARRRGMSSALIVTDLDGVKKVNDSLGHGIGDELIRDGASLLRESFRAVDIVARLGGDEFAVFTLDCDAPQGALDRLKQHVEAFNLQNARPYRVSFSAGVVACDPASSRPLAEYLALADERMYLQKRADRDGDHPNT